MSRTTANIADILTEANRLLKLETISQGEKQGICCLLESILQKADVYNGFNNLYWLSIGCTEWHEVGEPDFPEKNRFIYGPEGENGPWGEYSRFYYFHSSLKAKGV